MEKWKGQSCPRLSGGRSIVSLKCVTGLWMLFLVGCEPPALLDVSSGAVWVASQVSDPDNSGARSAQWSILDDKRLLKKILDNAVEVDSLWGFPQSDKTWPEFYLDEVPYSGWVKSTFANGRTEFLGCFKEGKANGIAVMWSSEGQILEQVYCSGGIQIGLATLWHESGAKKAEGRYKNDKRSGIWVKWYPSGQKWRQVHYKEGERDGSITYWHDNGQKWIEGQYRGGKMWGPWRSYHSNGHKSTEGAWREDERDGPWVFYDKYGEVKRRKTYKYETASAFLSRRRI